MAASFAHPVTPTVIQNLHLPDYMFGLALAVMQTTMFLFSPFWGKITSYISSRVSMCITMIGYGCGQILFAMAKNMRDVLLARLLAGCFTGGAFIASLAYVVNTSPEDLRGRYLTILATIQSVGSAFGYFIGGMLGVKGTQYSFIAQIAVLMASGVLFFFVCESDATKSKEELEMRTLVRECNPFAAFAAGKTFINRTWIKLLGICFMSYIGYNAFEQVFNYYIKDQFNLPSSYNGTIKFAVGIIALIANSTVCMYLIGRTDIKKDDDPGALPCFRVRVCHDPFTESHTVLCYGSSVLRPQFHHYTALSEYVRRQGQDRRQQPYHGVLSGYESRWGGYRSSAGGIPLWFGA